MFDRLTPLLELAPFLRPYRARIALALAALVVAAGATLTVPLATPETAAAVTKLIEALEDHDDVQKVHANFDVSDDVLAKLSH